MLVTVNTHVTINRIYEWKPHMRLHLILNMINYNTILNNSGKFLMDKN